MKVAYIPAATYIILDAVMFAVTDGSLLLNGVVGQPRVDCGAESIGVWIRTEGDFHGRLYVEEESEHNECVHSYAPTIGSAPDNGVGARRLLEFNIRFGQCNMRRQRILNPRGVAYSFTLVVSFHPVFLTGVDKAFNIKCFFLEAVKAIDIALDVSPLTTVVIEREFALPQCAYHLKQRPDGPFLKFANIGEPITHVWQCDPVAGWIYGVLIHSCYVDDGRGNRFDLIDERGCAVDRYLLDNLVYDEKGLGAFVNTHVFRYADRIQLFFTCTLQLCFKDDGGCRGITPPLCSNRSKSSRPKETSLSREDFNPRDLPIPSRLSPPREILHKFRGPPFRPSFLADRRASPRAHSSNAAPLGTPRNPYKDSALNNGTASELDLLEALVNETEAANSTVRTSRNAAVGRMETDLSADLTVLPLHEASSSINDPKILSNRSREASGKLNPHNETSVIIDGLPNLTPSTSAFNARLLSERDCSRWNRASIFGGALLLILTVAVGTSVVTSLVCIHTRKRQLTTGRFSLCDRTVQRMWQE